MAPTAAPRSAVRLFAVYAAVSAVAVLVLGLTLAASYRAEAGRRGLGEGQAQAQIVATAAIQPLLDGTDLRAGLDEQTKQKLAEIVRGSDGINRLRLRDL